MKAMVARERTRNGTKLMTPKINARDTLITEGDSHRPSYRDKKRVFFVL